jgi:GR25 family glycosyltransferase involved in LPS biosynthesis
VRIDAVYHPLGMLGCSLSHIKALEAFEANPEWKTCIIFEDDFTFRSSSISENNLQLSTFFKEFPSWDILSLSFNPKTFKSEPTHIHHIVKLIETWTASGYCLTKAFLPKIKQNFIESATFLNNSGTISHDYALDVYWNRLHPKVNWYAITPAIGYQYANYSNINHVFADHNC